MQKNANYLIYGAGNTGKRVLDILSQRGKVLGFIDANAKCIGFIKGLPVHTIPEAAHNSHWKTAETTVIVAVFNPLASMRAILSELADAGFRTVIDFFAFYRAHARDLGDLYWLSAPANFYEKNSGPVRETRALLADEKSRGLFDQIIKFRCSLDLNDIPAAEGVSSQYFPNDIPIRRDEVFFVDCGAYDGDTAAALPDYFQSVKGLECFEPDPANYSKLVARVDRAFPGHAVRKRFHPCGVTERRTILKFHAQGAGGKLSEDGEITVNCVALDDVLPPGLNRAYLKMDIEGAEMDALRGAEKFLRNGKIDTAICLYHKPEHLWEVPLFLHSLHDDYRFYLRLYGENIMETVLYGLRS